MAASRVLTRVVRYGTDADRFRATVRAACAPEDPVDVTLEARCNHILSIIQRDPDESPWCSPRSYSATVHCTAASGEAETLALIAHTGEFSTVRFNPQAQLHVHVPYHRGDTAADAAITAAAVGALAADIAALELPAAPSETKDGTTAGAEAAAPRATQVTLDTIKLSGPSNVVQPLSEALLRALGGRDGKTYKAVESMRMRLFYVDASLLVEPPRGLHGGTLAAASGTDEAENKALLPYIKGFVKDTFDTDFPDEKATAFAEGRGKAGELFKYMVPGAGVDGGDGDDAPVAAIAMTAGRSPHGARLGMIYTPDALRGRGYGGAVTYALSRHHIVTNGLAFCCLYTDLANPISNKIYQRIGYTGIEDFDQIRFEDAVEGDDAGASADASAATGAGADGSTTIPNTVRRLVEADKPAIEAFLRADAVMHAYALGDLDDRFWPKTQWYGLCTESAHTTGGGLTAVAVLYTGLETPCLLCLAGRRGAAGEAARNAELLRALCDRDSARLPDTIEAHVAPGMGACLTDAGFVISGHPHFKMGVDFSGRASVAGGGDGACDDDGGFGAGQPTVVEAVAARDAGAYCRALRAIAAAACEAGGFSVTHIESGDAAVDAAATALCASAPPSWFEPHVLSEGPYFGVWLDDDDSGGGRKSLVALGGTHVFSESVRVAALGNIVTHPSHRRRGLARAVVATLVAHMVGDCGIDTVALNVKTANTAAVGLYGSLGFETAGEFVEYGEVKR